MIVNYKFLKNGKMSVVDCKVKFIRPRFKDLKEWIENPDNIYIGRGGIVFIDKQRFPKQSSEFANPFKIGKDGTRDEVLAKYEKYITEKLEKDNFFQQRLVRLKGKNLGCWCHPEPCHGDILLKLIENYAAVRSN